MDNLATLIYLFLIENLVIYLPFVIIILATIITMFEKIFGKENKKIIRYVLIPLLGVLCILNIIAVMYKTSQEKEKDKQAVEKYKIDSIQKVLLVKKIDSLTDITILKQDGIKSFIEMYLLRDSVLKSKYDSINNFTLEKERPQIFFEDARITLDKNIYNFEITITNNGKRAATKFVGRAYVLSVSNVYLDSMSNECSVALPIYNTQIIPVDKFLSMGIPCNIELFDEKIFNNLFIYLRGTYEDIITKKKYTFNTLYKTIEGNYGKASSTLTLRRQWELDKVELFLFGKPK